MATVKKLRWLSISIGIVFFYFGILKFFPSLSPAEDIGSSTVNQLCLGILPKGFCIYALATLEVGIGISLISKIFYRVGIVVAIAHLVMTFSPLILFPDQAFNQSFLSPSLLGQYIFKNIILIMALIAIYPSKKMKEEHQLTY